MPEPQQPQPNGQPSPPPTPSPLPPRGFTLIVTNLVKLGGAAVVINETMIRAGSFRPIALAVAALMIAGAEGVETVIERLFTPR